MLRFIKNEGMTDDERAREISRSLHIHMLTAKMLVSRGILDEEAASAFLEPSERMLIDPFLFPDMDKAVSRITSAVSRGERIAVFGDYDADGVCATAILISALRTIGADAFYMIPSRHQEGYGMSMNAADELSSRGAKLVITVDNGIKSVGEIARLYELGIEAIITDHHIRGDELPRAEAILSADCYRNPDICGAGVALKLAWALTEREEAMKYISLAGIATIADVVPLTGENRALAALGLAALNSGACPIGLSALVARAGIKLPLNSRSIGFGIGPRLNAAGRIEEAGEAVELLITEDAEEAKRLSARLDELNTVRKNEEAAVLDEACALIEADDITFTRSIVLSSPNWNPGVVGIAAGRIAEKYARPAILFSEKDGVITGSARSVSGVDIHAALKACESLFIRFGGHAFAAGVTMELSKLEEFRAALERELAPLEAELFLPSARYDAEAEFSELTLGLARELALFAPYGEGNQEIVLRTDGARLRSLSSSRDGKHLRLTLAKDSSYASCMYFFAGERFEELNSLDGCDVLYTLSADSYMGRGEELKLFIAKLRQGSSYDAAKYIERLKAKFIDAMCANILYNSKRGLIAEKYALDAKKRVDSVAPDAICDAGEAFVSSVREKPTGTLALCFTASGAKRLLALANEENVQGRFDLLWGACENGPCAYNAAVLAPVLDRLCASRYTKVIVFDTALTLDMLRLVRLSAPRARIVCARQSPEDAKELLEAIDPRRERLAELYKALRSTRGEFYNLSAMKEALVLASKAPDYECTLALNIFAELGFIDTERGAKLIMNAANRALTESATYRTILALGANNDSYTESFKEEQ